MLLVGELLAIVTLEHDGRTAYHGELRAYPLVVGDALGVDAAHDAFHVEGVFIGDNRVVLRIFGLQNHVLPVLRKPFDHHFPVVYAHHDIFVFGVVVMIILILGIVYQGLCQERIGTGLTN